MTDFITRNVESDNYVPDFERIFKTFVCVHVANDFYESESRPSTEQTNCIMTTMLCEYDARFPDDDIFTVFSRGDESYKIMFCIDNSEEMYNEHINTCANKFQCMATDSDIVLPYSDNVPPSYFTWRQEYNEDGPYCFWEWADRDRWGTRPINVPLAEHFMTEFTSVIHEKYYSSAYARPILDELYTVYLAIESEMVKIACDAAALLQEEKENKDEKEEKDMHKLEDIESLKIHKVVRRIAVLRDQFAADFDPAMLLAEYIAILQDDDAMNIVVQYLPMVTQMCTEIPAILNLVDERMNRVYYIATTVRYNEYSDVSKRIIDAISAKVDMITTGMEI